MMLETTAASNGQERSAPRPSGATQAAGASWLVCRAGRRLNALPIERIAEVMRVLPLERISGAPPCVRGVSIIRGAAVPVVDIGLIVDGAAGEAKRLVTVKAADRLIALAVEAVVGIVAFAPHALGELPPLLHDAAADTIAAVGALDAELIVFLHAGRLVPDDVFALLDAKGAAA